MKRIIHLSLFLICTFFSCASLSATPESKEHFLNKIKILNDRLDAIQIVINQS
ncbi:hypothetical protein [Legionella waltersii]|uniref:Uncharacterized protein n=1 Tax=Legionella waltersii TaxID=66969 RepID=A0A0W1AN81_9GAMM|nr:hypothetical protein [Legionella waltersii]KTD82780.1 hypothetical protein Lwal_0258 [Legionella waltersii]SNV01281.1 Uncharacterised protein [Legionella waltersii]